jgi:flagellar L-ring protein precursor FlgH
MNRLAALLLATLILLAGCASTPARDPLYAATRPQPITTNNDNPGSIYQAGRGLSLFEDQRARRVGDVITVRLVEATQASKKAATKTKKETAVDLPSPTVLGTDVLLRSVPKFLPLNQRGNNNITASIDGSHEFTGEGSSSQGNSLTGSITVTVAEVLANGNLVVKGEKLLTLNQGHEHIRIAGIIRPADIAPDNSVLSTQVADAQITYAGEGALADSNSMGWLARVFNSPWWPF